MKCLTCNTAYKSSDPLNFYFIMRVFSDRPVAADHPRGHIICTKCMSDGRIIMIGREVVFKLDRASAGLKYVEGA